LALLSERIILIIKNDFEQGGVVEVASTTIADIIEEFRMM